MEALPKGEREGDLCNAGGWKREGEVPGWTQGPGEGDAEQTALVLNCVLSLGKSSTSRKWPLEHE